MRSVTAAILWEFWRCGRAAFLTVFLVVVAFSAFPIFGDWLSGNLHHDSDQRLFQTVHFLAVVLQVLAFPSAILIAQGQPSRHYARPVSTNQMVSCYLMAGALVTASLSLAANGLMNLVFGMNWPIVGPALVVAATTAVLQGTTWLTRGAPTLQAVSGAMAFFVPIFWFRSRMGAFSSSQQFWASVSIDDLRVIAAFGGMGVVIALIAIARDRCGDAFRWLRIQEVFDRLTVPFSADARFRSLTHAQLWYEWRQKGWWLPTVTIAALFFVLVLWSWDRRADLLQNGLMVVAITLVAAGIAAGVVLGRYNVKPGRYEMGTFLATRPISDAGITWPTLVTGALSLILCCALWAGASYFVYVPVSGGAPGLPFPFAIAIFSLGWLLLSIITCVMMTGRPRVFVIALNVFILLIMAGSSYGYMFAGGAEPRKLVLSLCGTLALVTLSATAVMFIKARRRHLIGWKTAAAGIALPVLALLYEVHLYVNGSGPDLKISMLGLITAGLFAAPLAAGPLAVAWNRHR